MICPCSVLLCLWRSIQYSCIFFADSTIIVKHPNPSLPPVQLDHGRIQKFNCDCTLNYLCIKMRAQMSLVYYPTLVQIQTIMLKPKFTHQSLSGMISTRDSMCESLGTETGAKREQSQHFVIVTVASLSKRNRHNSDHSHKSTHLLQNRHQIDRAHHAEQDFFRANLDMLIQNKTVKNWIWIAKEPAPNWSGTSRRATGSYRLFEGKQTKHVISKTAL